MSKNFKKELDSYMSNIKPSEKLINDTISLLEQEQYNLNNQKIKHNQNKLLYLLSSNNFKRYSALTFTILLSIFAVKLWSNSSTNDIPILPIKNDTIITNTEITSYDNNFAYTTTNSTSYLSSYDDFITNDTSTYTYTDTLTSVNTKTITTSNTITTIIPYTNQNTTFTSMKQSNNTETDAPTDNHYNISNNDVTLSNETISSNNDNNCKTNISTSNTLTSTNRPSITDIIPIITTKPLTEKVTTMSQNTLVSDITETPHTTNNIVLSTTSKNPPTNDITTLSSTSDSHYENITSSQIDNNANMTVLTTTSIVTTSSYMFTNCTPVTTTNIDGTYIPVTSTINNSNNSNGSGMDSETTSPSIKDYSIRNISGTDYNDTHPLVAIRFFFKNDINGYYYDDTLNINKILEHFPHSDYIPNNDCIITLSKNSSYCDAVLIYNCTFSELNNFILDFYKTITSEENEFAMPIVGESFIDYDNIITDNLDTSLVLAKLKLDNISLIDPRITVALNRISYLNQ